MPTTAARSDPFGRAFGLSVLLHVLILSLAAAPIVREALASWQALAETSTRVRERVAVPQEIEVMVPPIAVVAPSPPPQQFIHTEGLPETAAQSTATRFISDRNTRAASELPADARGAAEVPSQAGIDIPVVEIVRTPLSESDHEGEPTPPTPAVESTPPPPVAPPVAVPDPPARVASDPPEAPPPPPPVDLESIAITRDSNVTVRVAERAAKTKVNDPAIQPPQTNSTKVPPALREPALETRDSQKAQAERTPPPPRKATPPGRFSGLREPTRQHGTITNRGPASVDAADTPLGRYMKDVTSAIEREWHRKRRNHADWVTYGTIKLEFSVNRQGQVQSLTIKNRNGANAVMQDFTLNAVLDAKIPPMPAGLPEIFNHDRLEISYDIIVY